MIWLNIETVTYNTLKRFGAKLKPVNQTDNLNYIHKQYTKKIATIEHEGYRIAITSLTFCKRKAALLLNVTMNYYPNIT
ncbi:MAG: hypothetical protein K6U80_19185 [Firmicutes bacterium]|nr:hypothetical protein [Bacillota bacterium]